MIQFDMYMKIARYNQLICAYKPTVHDIYINDSRRYYIPMIQEDRKISHLSSAEDSFLSSTIALVI